MKPTAHFFVGLNGSGKSTLRDMMNLPDVTIIDPDKIKKDKSITERASGMEALSLFEDCIRDKKDFSMESTLTGKNSIRRIEQAKAAGFSVRAYYVALDSVSENISRVESRVLNGGHDIPRDTISRRYEDTFSKLPKLKEISDVLTVYDNSDSDDSFKKRAVFVKGDLKSIDLSGLKDVEGNRLNDFLKPLLKELKVNDMLNMETKSQLLNSVSDGATPQEKPVAVVYDAFSPKGLSVAEESISERFKGNLRIINQGELVKLHPDYETFKNSPEETEKQKNTFGKQAADFLMADAIQNRLNVAIEQGMDKTETPEQMISDFRQAAYQVVGYVNVDKFPELKQQVKTDSAINNMANRAENIYEARLTDQFIVAENKHHIFDSNDAPRYGNPVAIAINAAHKGISIKDEMKKEFGQTVETTKTRLAEEQSQKQSQNQGYDKKSLKL